MWTPRVIVIGVINAPGGRRTTYAYPYAWCMVHGAWRTVRVLLDHSSWVRPEGPSKETRLQVLPENSALRRRAYTVLPNTD